MIVTRCHVFFLNHAYNMHEFDNFGHDVEKHCLNPGYEGEMEKMI